MGAGVSPIGLETEVRVLHLLKPQPSLHSVTPLPPFPTPPSPLPLLPLPASRPNRRSIQSKTALALASTIPRLLLNPSVVPVRPNLRTPSCLRLALRSSMFV